jgi:hypothetical protein
MHVVRHERNPHGSAVEVIISLLTEKHHSSWETHSEYGLIVGGASPVKILNFVLNGEAFAVFFMPTEFGNSSVPDCQLVAGFIH